MINYNNKKFRIVSNSNNGELKEEAIFLYQQEGNILFSTYTFGQITKGHLLGVVDENGKITMSYHQVNQEGTIKTGTCTSIPEILKNGKIKLHESWKWTCGDYSEGNSILEEV